MQDPFSVSADTINHFPIFTEKDFRMAFDKQARNDPCHDRGLSIRPNQVISGRMVQFGHSINMRSSLMKRPIHPAASPDGRCLPGPSPSCRIGIIGEMDQSG